MASLTHTTIDHDEERRRVEEHDGEPGSVRGTERGGEDPHTGATARREQA